MISAIVLAAGQSRRMGRPKMLLPWGNLTVIEQVVMTFLRAGIEDIVVVTGGAREGVQAAIDRYHVRNLYNPDYATGEMLSSLQLGLRTVPPQARAVLIGLGDQPQVQEKSIRLLCEEYKATTHSLIVPSFNRRRGHPWLVARPLWEELLALRPPRTLRDFLSDHTEEIHYITMDTPSILADLDTPDDYKNSLP